MRISTVVIEQGNLNLTSHLTCCNFCWLWLAYLHKHEL